MHSARMVTTEPCLLQPAVQARACRRGAACTGLGRTSSPADCVQARHVLQVERSKGSLPRLTTQA